MPPRFFFHPALPDLSRCFLALSACAALSLAACAPRSQGKSLAQTATSAHVDAPKGPFAFLPRQERERLRQESARGAQSASRTSASQQQASLAGGAWTIVLAAFQGNFAEETAAQLKDRIAQQAPDMKDVRIARREGSVQLVLGRYNGPDDPKAQADLVTARDVSLDGVRAFADARLSPPSQADRGSLGDFDLATLRSRLGESARYTLLVARYGDPSRAAARPTPEQLQAIRKAAEEATLTLRAAGDEAFFWHAPFGSSVTVGAFGELDHITQVPDAKGGLVTLPRPRESPMLVQTRQRHPFFLLNGQAVRVGRSAGSGTAEGAVADESQLQPSMLVEIPK